MLSSLVKIIHVLQDGEQGFYWNMSNKLYTLLQYICENPFQWHYLTLI
jgi:hypothetical protein